MCRRCSASHLAQRLTSSACAGCALMLAKRMKSTNSATAGTAPKFATPARQQVAILGTLAFLRVENVRVRIQYERGPPVFEDGYRSAWPETDALIPYVACRPQRLNVVLLQDLEHRSHSFERRIWRCRFRLFTSSDVANRKSPRADRHPRDSPVGQQGRREIEIPQCLHSVFEPLVYRAFGYSYVPGFLVHINDIEPRCSRRFQSGGNGQRASPVSSLLAFASDLEFLLGLRFVRFKRKLTIVSVCWLPAGLATTTVCGIRSPIGRWRRLGPCHRLCIFGRRGSLRSQTRAAHRDLDTAGSTERCLCSFIEKPGHRELPALLENADGPARC